VAEVYGLGVVAISAISPSVIDAIRMADRLGDTLLGLVETEWPRAVVAAAAVDLRVISRILETPEILDDLEPRALEVLIGKLFRGFGARVELTKETRDGGYDVGATFDIGDARFHVLIEAERWFQDRKVGIATVDRLIGVKQRLKADKVVLATTSTFTNIAKKAAAELRTEIELVDRYGLADWVEQYLLPREGSALRLPSIPVQALGDS
jgi:restriction endonuclease Mrr